MSVNITSYPEVSVNSDATKVSKWNAVHHPIKFGMHRKDSACNNTQATATSIYCTVSTTVGMLVGDVVYIETLNGSGLFTVTIIDNSTTFRVELNGATGMLGSGFVNFQTRLNYFVSTKIWGVDANNNYYLIGESINRPDVSGRVSVDVSSFLKNIVDYIDTFTYNKLNKKDLTLGGRFNITYSENWLNYEGAYSTISTTVLRYFTNSVKQIQDLYGSNMGEYVPFSNKAYDTKFLSDFESPTYFVGFPFSLSFIYSESLFAQTTTKHEDRKDINGNILTSNNTSLDANECLWVNRLMLDQNYPTNVKSVDVWLENDGTSTPLEYFEDDYVVDGYVGPQTAPTPINNDVLG